MKNKTLVAIFLFAAIWAFLHFIFELRFVGIQRLWLLAIYFLVYFFVNLLSKKDIGQDKENERYKDWPTSGPIGKYGQKGLLLAFYTSGLLTFLNPFQLFQIIKQAIGNFKLGVDKSQVIDDAEEHHNETDYILPFENNIEWLVYNGGINKYNSHSWDVLTQRFAYDFVIADDNFNRHENKGTRVRDYYCFAQNIAAVADGTIVKVVNTKRTAPFVGYGVLDFLTTSFTGNSIVIKHKDNEYSFYAHLVKGSIAVQEGERVSQGQLIGKCGHSGYSSEPHLHFHLQDKADFFFAKGLPIRFSNIEVNGQEVSQSYISVSDRVSNT